MSYSSSPSTTQAQPVAELFRLLREADPLEPLLGQLRERGFVAAPDSTVELAASPADQRLDRADAVAHIDPRQPRAAATLPGATMGMYVSDCILNTESEPSYLRLPSFPELNPYLIAYLLGFPPNETRNVLVQMQVFSTGGSVRLTATGNPTGVTVGYTSFPIAVPITLTTTAEGFASVFIQRSGQTGFDWHAVDVL